MVGTSSHSIHKTLVSCHRDRNDVSWCTAIWKWYQGIPYASLSCLIVLRAVAALHNASEPGWISSVNSRACVLLYPVLSRLFFVTETQMWEKLDALDGTDGKVDRWAPVRTNKATCVAEFARSNYNVLCHLLNLWEAWNAAFVITWPHRISTSRWHRQADINAYT